MGLDTIREIVQPWYEKASPLATVAYIVVMASISYGIFQFLFLTPAKTAGTSGPTAVNFYGNNIQQLTVVVSGGPSALPPQSDAETIVENASFEQGVQGWGTGFFEGLFLQPGHLALGFNNAIAHWYIDDHRVHSGSRALRVDHQSAYSPHVFSSLSQRVKVKPSHRYEVKFWAYLEATDRAAFSLRVLPSRRIQPEEWDRFKRKLDPTVINQWQEVRLEFESSADAFFDLRFAAEAPLKAWVDDVAVTPLGAARAR